MVENADATFRYPYEAVAADLRGRLLAGEWEVGGRLPTVSEIAQQYPHSRATVNRALQTLAEQGYLSLDRGRGIHVLQQQAPARIGLLAGPSLLEHPTHPFAASLARAARDYFEARGVEHRLYIEQQQLLREGLPCHNLQKDMEAGWLHGLITAQSNAPGHLHYSSLWRRRGLPLVNIGSHHRVDHCVTSEPGTALHLALGVVRERGAREVAVMSYGDLDLRGIDQLLQTFECRTRETWFPQPAPGVDAEEQGYLNVKLIWEQDETPEALVILDDVVAKGAMQALLELGVRVPRDLCLVHGANRNTGLFFPIAAPRLECDPAEYIAKAADLVLELVEHPDLPPRTEHVTFRLRLEDGGIRPGGASS